MQKIMLFGSTEFVKAIPAACESALSWQGADEDSFTQWAVNKTTARLLSMAQLCARGEPAHSAAQALAMVSAWSLSYMLQ